MKPRARLALIEFKAGPWPEGPPEAVKISRAELSELGNAAGLALDWEKSTPLPYQNILVFRKGPYEGVFSNRGKFEQRVAYDSN